jgi:endonuclease-3
MDARVGPRGYGEKVSPTSLPRKTRKTASRKPGQGWKPPSRTRVLRIRDRLREVYGIPRMAPHGRSLDELVLTVLSQSTNDRNRDVAFLRLRERFAAPDERIDYAAMLAAPVSEVEEAIRPGGISKVKSARIQAILAAISASARDPDEPLSLDWMRDAPVEQSRAYLCALPGVGRKTAACVLLFSYGLPDIPVDTHVSRVGTRLGLFRPGAPFEELHDQMLALTPPGHELEFHVNLLRHGRRTCHARNPACDECALARMCPSRVTPSVRP